MLAQAAVITSRLEGVEQHERYPLEYHAQSTQVGWSCSVLRCHEPALCQASEGRLRHGHRLRDLRPPCRLSRVHVVRISLHAAALRYSDFLLRQIRIATAHGRWDVVSDLCDRFERVLENLPPVPYPLVWHGDYA